MKMPIVIFCGGQGTRMKEETEFRPKPMVPVGGQPILWHIMKIYAHYGYNEFIIALGYKGDYIKNYFLNQQCLQHDFVLDTETGEKYLYAESRKDNDNFKITFVDTGVETPTGGRLLQVAKYIKTDTFMATYGDGVGDVNIDQLVKYFEKMRKIGVVTGVHPTSKWGLIVADNKGVVEKFQEKPNINQYVNGGFMIFQKSFLKYLKSGDMIHDAFPRLAKKKEIAVFRHEGFWAAMDTYQDVEELNKQWKVGPKWKVWE